MDETCQSVRPYLQRASFELPAKDKVIGTLARGSRKPTACSKRNAAAAAPHAKGDEWHIQAIFAIIVSL
jgi:hypothetical protein